MTQRSERRPGGGGAAADNANRSDRKNSPPTAPAQGNPLLALVTELGGVLGGTWPGEIRRLMDVDRPLPLAIGIRDAIAAAVNSGRPDPARHHPAALDGQHPLLARPEPPGRPPTRYRRHDLACQPRARRRRQAADRGAPAAVGARGQGRRRRRRRRRRTRASAGSPAGGQPRPADAEARRPMSAQAMAYGASTITRRRRTKGAVEQLERQILDVLEEDHPQSVRMSTG